MAATPFPRVSVLEHIGAWLPPNAISNQQLTERLDTSDEWIRRRTGIGQRFRVTEGMAASDLAVAAGRRALDAAGDPRVDAVIVTTSTPDHPLPATAPAVAARLGLGGVLAFDVAAVCTGFLYGLAVTAGLIANGTAGRILLIASEVYSSIIDPDDRATAVIFGDGAAAVVIRAGEAGEPGVLGPVILGSDGGSSDLIQVPAGGSRQRTSGKPAEPGAEFFRMDGREVFRQAVHHMAESSRQAVSAAGWRLADVDRLAAHQANARILAVLAGELEIPAERVLSNIDKVGNTGAASIPLLLEQSAAEGKLVAGDRVLLTAFGGGLTWGAATMTWPKLSRPT